MLLRKPFFEITNDPKAAEARGRRLVLLGPRLLRASFGFVVTSSVQIAGVLLVFGLLVIPAVAGLIASDRPGVALAVGWVFGFAASVVGLVGSVRFDMPAAPSILVTLSGLLLVMSGIVAMVRRGRAQ